MSIVSGCSSKVLEPWRGVILLDACMSLVFVPISRVCSVFLLSMLSAMRTISRIFFLTIDAKMVQTHLSLRQDSVLSSPVDVSE